MAFSIERASLPLFGFPNFGCLLTCILSDVSHIYDVLNLFVHSIFSCSRVREDYGMGATALKNEEDVSVEFFPLWSALNIQVTT